MLGVFKKYFMKFIQSNNFLKWNLKYLRKLNLRLRELRINPYVQFKIKDFDKEKKKNERKDFKIVGLMITWNNLEFFQFTIQQALEFCDEVLLIEGGHSNKFPKRSVDGTVEFIKKIKKHPNLRVFDFNFREKYNNYYTVQLHIRMDALRKSKLFRPGNWYILWDDDNFFFNKDLIKLKKILATTKNDTIVFNERKFIYNFRFNTFNDDRKLLYRGGGQIDRIRRYTWIKGFLKMVNPRLYYGRTRKYDKILYLDDIVSFHYHQVKKSERVKVRWEMAMEKGYTHIKDRYEKFLSISWDGDADVYKHKELIEDLNGEKGFNVYTGPHPEILDAHPWRFIDDVRNNE